MEERKNVVYAVPCGDCGIRYFGETSSILVIGEASIREMLKLERQQMVSFVTYKKMQDTKLTGKVLFLWTMRRTGKEGKSRRRYILML